MSRIEELFQDIAEEFAQGNRQEREYSRSEIDTSDLYKDDALLLSTLAGLGTAPVAAPAWLANFAGRAAAPLNKMYGAVGGDIGKQAINKKELVFPGIKRKIDDYVRLQKNADEKMMFQQKQIRNNIRNRPPLGSGSRVSTDVAGRTPMPQTKPPLSVVRGPRGNTNIDAPVQRNLDLSDLKPTGIQNTTQARGMNPKMRESLTTRRDNIQQDIFKMESQSNLNESVDMQKLFRLQDELKALNKTLLD